MNWTDFMIAIKKGLIPSKQELVDGTTTVGNANKLGGKSASEYRQKTQSKLITLPTPPTEENDYLVQGGDETFPYKYGLLEIRYGATIYEYCAFYKTIQGVYFNFFTSGEWHGWHTVATTADDTSLTGWTELTNGFDLNNALGKYRTASSTVLASLVNRPESVGYGEITVEWFPSVSTNQYGTQVLKHTYSTSPTLWARTRQTTTWTIWQKITTNADLANYLSKSGGKVSASGAVNFSLENISGAVVMQEFINSSGTCGYLGFQAIDKPIYRTSSGTYNPLLHSGNVGDYALPKSGGTVGDGVNGTPISVKGNAGQSMLLYRGSDESFWGLLGFDGKDNPAYINSEVSKTYQLHHDGNSAKVAVSDTAPADTNTVWFDTSEV